MGMALDTATANANVIASVCRGVLNFIMNMEQKLERTFRFEEFDEDCFFAFRSFYLHPPSPHVT